MRKSRRQYERERLEAYSELWDFLGRDTLGERITWLLVHEGWVYLDFDVWSEGVPRCDITTEEGLRTAYADKLGRRQLQNARGIGSVAMARIAERCTQTEA